MGKISYQALILMMVMNFSLDAAAFFAARLNIPCWPDHLSSVLSDLGCV
jgi:hypothetical protein